MIRVINFKRPLQVVGSLSKTVYLLPLLLAVTFLVLLIESFKYPGFMANHFYIDAKVYFAVSVFSILYLTSDTRIMWLVFKLNRIALVLLTIVYTVFVLIEGAHFTNYVLSRYSLHLDGLILLVLFCLFIFLAEKFRDEVPKTLPKFGAIYPLIVLLLIFFFVKNSALVANTVFNRTSFIFFHLSSSYDEKMAFQWGIFYEFMVFVRNNTPEDATIIIPPEQDPWLMGSGNDNFVRAFLYPRKVVPQPLIIPEESLENFGPGTYILITWGKGSCRPDPECHGWPRQNIYAKKIFYKNPVSNDVIETKQNQTYYPKGSKYVYGLIEI